jgi:hypothetical protein
MVTLGGKPTTAPTRKPWIEGRTQRVLQDYLAHHETHPLGPYSTPIYSPRVVLAGRGGLGMSEVPLYPQRPERAPRPESSRVEEWLQCHYLEAMSRRYVVSRLLSDMRSAPAALASTLAAAED